MRMLIAGLLIVLALGLIGTTAADIYVDEDNAGDSSMDGTWDHPYNTIQRGIDNATSGEDIYVWGGSYWENVIVNKTVNLIGNGTSETRVNASNSGDVFYVTFRYVNISGFNITGSGYGVNTAGIQFDEVTNGNVSDCSFMWNEWAVFLDGSDHIDITDCYFSNNTEGIRGYNADYADIYGCDIFGSDYEGINFVSSSDYDTIVKCNVSWNNRNRTEAAGGIDIDGSNYINITQSYISHNAKYGVHLVNNGFRNDIYDNDIVWNCGGVAGVFVDNCAYTLVSSNRIENSTGEGVAVYGRWGVTVWNNTLWNNNRLSGMTGIYVSASHNIHISENVVARGNFSGIYVQATQGARIHDNMIFNNTEHGIWITTSNDTVIAWNVITGNQFNGILLTGTSTNSTVHNNTILYNNMNMGEYLGGIKLLNAGWFDIDNNTISNNPRYGIWLDEVANGTVRANEVVFNCGGRAGLGMRNVRFTHVQFNNISNSTGHGIDASGIDSCVIHNNTIVGNNMNAQGDGGIYVYDSWKCEFNDNVILNNTGYGARMNYVSNCSMMGNTISGHNLDGLFIQANGDNWVIVENTVTWNNLDDVGYRAGIRLDSSGWCKIGENIVMNNKKYGIRLFNSDKNTIEWNDLLWNCGGEAGLVVHSSDRNMVMWNNISNSTGTGIDVLLSHNNTFHNNTLNGNAMEFSANSGGIYLSYSHWNTITDNIVLDNRLSGMSLHFSENNTMRRNDIGRNSHGFYSTGSRNNTVVNCSIWMNSGYGITTTNAWHSWITQNEIFNNTDHGINIHNSEKGVVFLNNLYGNGGTSSQGYDNTGNNTWDNGTHGNYWDDYNGTDGNDDGIGDTPYGLDGGWYNDTKPLTNRTDNNVPREVPEFGILITVGMTVVVFAAVFRRRRLA